MMADFLQDYEVSKLLAKELTGTLSPEEEKVLQEWKQQHPELVERIGNVANRQLRDEFIGTIDLDRSWEKVRRQTIVSPRKKIYFWQVASVAASVVLCVGLALNWWLRQDVPSQEGTGQFVQIETGSSKALLITSDGREIGLQDSTIQQVMLEGGVTAMNDGKKVIYSDTLLMEESEVKYNTIRVPKGGEYELLLADRTKVMLNSETELRFPVKFGSGKRDVYLKGEAYFVVTKDVDHPFVVHISDRVSVEVLGTEFNVMAYPDELKVEATLNKGAVRFSNTVDSVVLKPDQQAVYDKSSQALSTRRVEADKYSAWKDGRFIFENESLESILVRLGRWYNIQVTYVNPEAKKFHFTGDLERYEHFSKALNMLEKATNVKFMVDKNSVIVSTTR